MQPVVAARHHVHFRARALHNQHGLHHAAGNLRRLISVHLQRHLAATAQAFVAYGASIYPAVLGFGAFLMALTILGLEHNQAFSSLAHPGYKHFLRLRVRRDGSAVDGWVLGKIDTLDPKAEIVLVDRFTWNNPRHRGADDAATTR